MSRTYPVAEPWEVPDPWHPIFDEVLDPIVEPVVTRYARPAQRHEDATLFGPRVACELYWANHPIYSNEWTGQVLLDVKRQRAREFREAGYWEVFLDRSGLDCGILLYAYGERLAKAISHLLGLDYCPPGEGWLNDDAWARSYELGGGEVLRYRLVSLLRCRRLRMRIASGIRRVLRRKSSALPSLKVLRGAKIAVQDAVLDGTEATMQDVLRVIQESEDGGQ